MDLRGPWSGIGVGVLNHVCRVNVLLLHHHQLAPVVHGQQQEPLHHLQRHLGVTDHRIVEWFGLGERQSPRLSYLGLTLRVLQQGHGVRVWNRVGNYGGAKDFGQVGDVHFSVGALSHPALKAIKKGCSFPPSLVIQVPVPHTLGL